MPPAPHPSPRILRVWILVRLLLGLTFALLLVFRFHAALETVLSRLDCPHDQLKFVFAVWHALLARAGSLRWLALVGLAGGAVATLPARPIARVASLLLLVGALLAVQRPHSVAAAVLLVVLLAAGLLPRRRGAWVAWVPGSLLLLPRLVVRALRPGLGRGADAGAGAVTALAAVALWSVADPVMDLQAAERDAALWPDRLLDPRVSVLDRTLPGQRYDYQDIDVVGDRLVVVAETPPRLLSFPLAGGPVAREILPGHWEQGRGVSVESDSDPSTRRTWLLVGPDSVRAYVHRDDGWERERTSPRLAGPRLLHAATTWLADRQELVLISVNVSIAEVPVMYVLGLPDLETRRVVQLREPDGAPLPFLRDATWVPPLGAFVLCPDFGERLYLADPRTGVTRRWLELPVWNGRPVWEPRLARLFVPRTDRSEVWVVEPVSGAVERTLPAQPGVRTLAVDAENRVYLTASVITGDVEVRDLDDGRLLDTFSRFMPMVRLLRVLPGRAEAVLASWTTLYRIPYRSSLERRG